LRAKRILIFREEAGCHADSDRLEATFSAVTAAPPPPDPRIPRDRLVRRSALTAADSEAVTFGFIEAGGELSSSPRAAADRRRQSAVGEVRYAQAVALPGCCRCRVAQIAGMAAATCACSRSARASRLTGDARRGVAWTGNATDDHGRPWRRRIF
jgi:hypothetical protein